MSDVNHQEAYEFAGYTRHNSNLARAYLDLRKQLEQAEGIQREVEAQLGCQKGSAIVSIIHMKDTVRELYKRLEQSNIVCEYWRLLAEKKEATSPASPQAESNPQGSGSSNP